MGLSPDGTISECTYGKRASQSRSCEFCGGLMIKRRRRRRRQNVILSVSRAERGSTGLKWTSYTGAVSFDNCEG
jgi:hypothetical protein